MRRKFQFEVQPGSSVPIYRQLVDQIRRNVVSGVLGPGERLPSVRALARELVINHNTVARAYRELEHERFVATRHGDGVFVADRSSPFLESDRKRLLREALSRFLVEAEQLGAQPQEIEQLILQHLKSRGEQAAGAQRKARDAS